MRERKLNGSLLFVIVCILITGLIGNADASQKQLKWKMAFWGPRLPVYEKIYDEFSLDVEKASNGRLIIEFVCEGEGIQGSQVLESVGSGLVEMGILATVYHAGKFPAGIIEWGLPGANLSLEEYMALFEETKWKEVLSQAYAVHNVEWLGSHPTHETYVLTKKPIKSIDDFKGLKLRAVGANAKFARNLNALPVSVPYGEIYTGLATGVFEGILGSPILDISDGKFHEIAKYLYPLSVSGYITNPFIVNVDQWKKLDEDLKAILKLAVYKCALMYRVKLRMVLQETFNGMQEKGVKWGPKPSESDKAKWDEAAMKIWSEYEKDKYSKELVRIQTEFIKSMEPLKH